MSDDPNWFAPKRFGYGSGLPISWQGWALTIVYTAVIVSISLALSDRPLILIAAIIAPTVVFIVIAANTTKGGWRWRWGKDQD